MQIYSQKILQEKWQEWQSKLTKSGYIQMSDRPLEPKHYWINEQTLPSWEEIHRSNFIREAAFCLNDEEQTSITIRQYDAGWMIQEHSLKKVQQAERTIKYQYIALSGKHQVQCQEIWEKKKDDLCEGFETWQAGYIVFTGIKEIKS
jgi:CRISPR type III-associated protein (TIGR04423 family)